MSARGVVIVGGGLAGMTTASELVDLGYPHPITVLGDERHQAYARPPLSKGVLKGTDADNSVLLPDSPSGQIRVRVSSAVIGLDVAARQVALADGRVIGYDNLVIASGGRPRRLGDGTGQHVVRTIDDTLRLRDALRDAADVVVIGGGFLGMEVASAALSFGARVRVIDVRTPLVPVLGETLGRLTLAAAHEHGVKVEVCPAGVVVECEESGQVRRVTSRDGRAFPADVVVTAIGDMPNTEWLRGSGVALDAQGWVVVDDYARAHGDGFAPGEILAAGDVALLPQSGEYRRMPHWENAIGQAKAVARTLVDGPRETYTPDPYFWTEAFGIAYKIAGPIPPEGEPEVIKGDLDDRCALVRWAGAAGTTVAAVNHRIPVAKLRRQARRPQNVPTVQFQ
ncbi:NAD(P)/FAD-dependent oxidoreductase [Gordonia otitidis]|uniref:NAD(P)/FAD-dependent oxidoreductase n=1 Tax=Gordonia otitidis TaxID=249058 RepID=UPI001D15BB8C|nr:NAD(P)/FAD-dependent oxidoreductase [Gordonia otitidis]UEA60869.1 NAD(P)/FAD-dependent oxidoreductase [Gordonia otitidis]